MVFQAFKNLSRENDCVNCFKQGGEPFDFSGSGSVWVLQRFQISLQFRLRFRKIETVRFGFAPAENISKPVYEVPVQVHSQKWYSSSNTI